MKNRWWLFLGLCLVFKLSSAYFVYGPQALDDYLNTLLRVKHWLGGQDMDLATWRSPLIVWMLGIPVRGVEGLLGELSPVGRIRLIYGFLAIFSMIAPLGAWLYCRRPGDARFRWWALGLVCFHGLVAFISTRALGEAMAFSLMLLGVGLSEAAGRQDQKYAFWGFVALGWATLLRFQCGVFFVPYAILFVWRERSFWKAVAAASLLTLLAQVAIDLGIGRYPLQTVFDYLLKNKDPTIYGSQPWWSTWATWAVFLFMPFSLVFLGHFKKFWERHRIPFVSTLIFLAVHSLIAHKEERFIYPVLGLSLVFLAWFLAQENIREWSRVRKTMFTALFTLNAFLLFVGSFQNTQVGVVEPLAVASLRYKNFLIEDYGSPIHESQLWQLFVSETSQLLTIDRLQQSDLEQSFQNSRGPQALLIASARLDRLPELQAMSQWSSPLYQCSVPQMASSWTDRLVYRLNPQHNARRRPNYWVLCSRK